jgi:thiol:disulfide interchange protein DsbD
VGGIIAAPCTGPVLASVLAYVSTTRSVMLGGSLLFTYALGMGVLFFLIAAFAVSLPKSGGWMEAVKSIFGIAMAVLALYFLRNVSKSIADYGRHTNAWLAAHLVALLAGILLGGVHLSFHDSLPKKIRKGVGVALIVVGVFGTVGWLLASRPAEANANSTHPPLTWIKGEAAGLAAAKAANKPALLDFYADWCLPCKEMELKTFENEEVAQELALRYVLVKVDMTSDEDPAVLAVRDRYAATTLPTLVLLGSDGNVAHKIDHYVEPKELLLLLRPVR